MHIFTLQAALCTPTAMATKIKDKAACYYCDGDTPLCKWYGKKLRCEDSTGKGDDVEMM